MRGRRFELLRATDRGGRATNAELAAVGNRPRLPGDFPRAGCPEDLVETQVLGLVSLPSPRRLGMRVKHRKFGGDYMYGKSPNGLPAILLAPSFTALDQGSDRAHNPDTRVLRAQSIPQHEASPVNIQFCAEPEPDFLHIEVSRK